MRTANRTENPDTRKYPRRTYYLFADGAILCNSRNNSYVRKCRASSRLEAAFNFNQPKKIEVRNPYRFIPKDVFLATP